ncbi:MAG TPA: thioredoxin family protein, partial [Phenylobacterium sp.]
HEAAARRQGLAFGVGVLATFLGLAALLIALRAAGNQLGWGFQLQDPPVVAALALLMLAVALNLSGLFEVGTSLQGVGSGLATGGGLAGSFFTGVLAVVVAAPCTAPFMGPAVGWALTQPPAASLVVFLGLAVGFALPFVAVAFVPGLLARLPRPGPWMETFKKALAFPMYGTVAWLVWVLTVQVGSDAVPRILGAGILLAAAAWIIGAAQKRAVMGGKPVVLTTLAALLAVVAVAGGAFWPQYTLAATPEATSANAAHLDYEPYTPERLAALRAEGRPVLVNYTAAWCVSCQVNDRVALSTTSVQDALKRNNAVYLKADWTKRDAAIAAELASFGRAGVPLYLVYGAKGGEPAILPSILTTGVVVKALDAAAKSS